MPLLVLLESGSLNIKSGPRISKTGTLPALFKVPGYSIDRKGLFSILDPKRFWQILFLEKIESAIAKRKLKENAQGTL